MHTRRRAAWTFLAPLLALSAAPAFAQSKDDDLSQAHVRMYKRIAPSVVFVAGGQKKGTGVVIDKGGYILTSPTACGETTTEVSVQIAGLKRLTGKVVGRVNELELVVVKVAAKDLAAVEMADSDKAKPGAVTYAFGDSFGSMEVDGQVAMSLGTLSAIYEVTRTVQKGTLYTGPVLETSGAVNPEQDGGPLVDAHGRLLGIITLNYDDSKFTGIAVPINRLKPHIERIIREDREGVAVKPHDTPEPVTKKEPGWLGADVEEDDEAGGVAVTRLFRNGPAEKGGLKKGDVIRQVNRQRVMTRKRFEELVGKLEEGATATFKVRRDGKDIDVTVTLGKKVYY